MLIISIILIGRWGLVESLWQCPFPGIPSNGLAWNDRNESVTWENRSNIFLEGQQVRYYCLDHPIHWLVKLTAKATESGTGLFLSVVCSLNIFMKLNLIKCLSLERQVDVKLFGYKESGDSYLSFNQTNPCESSSDKFKNFYIQADFPDDLEYFNIAIEKCSSKSKYLSSHYKCGDSFFGFLSKR